MSVSRRLEGSPHAWRPSLARSGTLSGLLRCPFSDLRGCSTIAEDEMKKRGREKEKCRREVISAGPRGSLARSPRESFVSLKVTSQVGARVEGSSGHRVNLPSVISVLSPWLAGRLGPGEVRAPEPGFSSSVRLLATTATILALRSRLEYEGVSRCSGCAARESLKYPGRKALPEAEAFYL